MKIIDSVNAHIEEGKPFIAFEFYPPRTADGVANLHGKMAHFAAQKPLYADFTWGAGGSTAELTLDLVVEVKKRHGVETNMHMTCTNMPVEKITTALDGAIAGGIENVLALRGDPPAGESKWEAVEGGFRYASDLVAYIKEHYGDKFCLSVAGYPEGHPDHILPVGDRTMTDSEAARACEIDGVVNTCSDADYADEIAHLAKKVTAGAQMIVTQMFFDTALYFQFVKDCRAAGINVPIIPGIMLINAYGGFKRMTTLCKSRVPAELWKSLNAISEDAEAIKAFGIEFGVKMCRELLAGGAPGLHFYTLNLEKVVMGILEGLGMYNKPTEDAPADDAAAMAKGTIFA